MVTLTIPIHRAWNPRLNRSVPCPAQQLLRPEPVVSLLSLPCSLSFIPFFSQISLTLIISNPVQGATWDFNVVP